ncbi:MAG: LptA/OstA family protein [Erythrobacter sp.]|uniref:LptA/OstA family protein n=1 Tax=Erythrobacter sp. TaxID=1042 RepID=UPI002637FEBE|nr:LptA/OstA family protein [Erythrobacter sp.]MDJ0978313.1 LptA/OstA family protein [Erythrobacter sp.]
MSDTQTLKRTIGRASSLAGLSIVYALGGFTLTLALMGDMQLSAQGFSAHNTRAPVDIDAGRIVAQEREDRVVFSDNVIVTQDDLTVRAARMQLNYLNASTLELKQITATGGVSVARGNQRATGSTAVYDFSRRIITLSGDVRLRQGNNTLSGGRLVIDLDTGISSVDGRASGGSAPAGSTNGRVRGTFTVPQEEDEPEN